MPRWLLRLTAVGWLGLAVPLVHAWMAPSGNGVADVTGAGMLLVGPSAWPMTDIPDPAAVTPVVVAMLGLGLLQRRGR